jgi:WhiB family transcriptional regulator, redox-sensing transcriptional regulator
VRSQDWQERRACRGVDPRLFDPASLDELRAVRFQPQRIERLRAAHRVCAGCPVRVQCAAELAGVSGPVGVWAGEYRGGRTGAAGPGKAGA